MKTSNEYKEKLKKKFRFNKSIWTTSQGTPYIGYNHAVKPTETFPDRISKKEASLIFDTDVRTIEKFLTRNLGRSIPQRHFDIMVSLCYDIGSKALKNSLFFNLYVAGDIDSAFKHYMTWGKKNGGLIQSWYNRRKEELDYINYKI